jgi:hypothetical protein
MLLSRLVTPWLEYPLCSLALLFAGSYLIDYIQKNEASR